MRSSDESARRPPGQPRQLHVDLRLPWLRAGAILPWRRRPASVRDELAASEVVHAANAVSSGAGAFVLGGAEPLRRGDLWELLAELIALRPEGFGLCTAGVGVTAEVVQRLREAGVQRLLVPFHCARQDAHDWLVGQSGALKTAHRAIRASVEGDLPVTAEIVLTRPTMPHLAETIEVLARVGVRNVCVRRLTAADTEGVEFVSLSPRVGLLAPSLERAARVALERRVHLRLRDLPLCAAPRLRRLFAAPDSEAWIMADGSVRTRAGDGVGCTSCPGLPECAGAPDDYVTRFGWEEFRDPVAAAPRVHESVTDQQQPAAAPPLVFAWRGPHRVRCESCGDGATANPLQPYDSTRIIRARLVEAARYRPAVLRLVGADLLAHPQAAALIFDALRLFPHVEVAGEASAAVDWSELELRRMKDLKRFDVALYGPDAATHDAHCGIPGAFAATLRAVERVRAHARIPVGAYAVLHDARWVAAFADAWERGALPGAPRFRLSARGGSLDELVECAGGLAPGRARTALLAVLPQCLCERAGLAGEAKRAADGGAPAAQRVECGRAVPYSPCGSDPIGAFDPCAGGTGACALSGCSGTAVGWHSTARAERWSGSSI